MRSYTPILLPPFWTYLPAVYYWYYEACLPFCGSDGLPLHTPWRSDVYLWEGHPVLAFMGSTWHAPYLVWWQSQFLGRSYSHFPHCARSYWGHRPCPAGQLSPSTSKMQIELWISIVNKTKDAIGYESEHCSLETWPVQSGRSGVIMITLTPLGEGEGLWNFHWPVVVPLQLWS